MKNQCLLALMMAGSYSLHKGKNTLEYFQQLLPPGIGKRAGICAIPCPCLVRTMSNSHLADILLLLGEVWTREEAGMERTYLVLQPNGPGKRLKQ